jgi:hypothetical protein
MRNSGVDKFGQKPLLFGSEVHRKRAGKADKSFRDLQRKPSCAEMPSKSFESIVGARRYAEL